MFCGKCGKEMDSSAKFCPYCGAENQNRTPAPPTAKPTVPVKLSGGTVDMAKIALMVLGALHTLLFFTMSYGQIHLMSALNAIVGSNFSNRLTALNAISLMKGCADLGIDGAGVALVEVTVLALLPVAMGLIVLALSLKRNGKRGGLLPVVLSVVTLLAYLVLRAGLSANAGLGLTVDGGMPAYVISVLQIVASVLCIRTDGNQGKT